MSPAGSAASPMPSSPYAAKLGCGSYDVKEVRREMTLTRKDVLATVLTGLAVLVFFAAHEDWNVWLVGSGNRWAAAAIMLLGAVTCGLGSAGDEMSKGAKTDTSVKVLAAAGVVAAVFAVWAIVTGSLTALSLLTLCIVVLWAGSTLRHAWHPTHGPVAT